MAWYSFPRAVNNWLSCYREERLPGHRYREAFATPTQLILPAMHHRCAYDAGIVSVNSSIQADNSLVSNCGITLCSAMAASIISRIAR